MNKKNITITIISLAIILLLIIVNSTSKLTLNINKFYQVYLNGEKIGLITNKDELYTLIDNNQSSIKKEYSVNTVYPPTDLKIVPTNSYVGVADPVEEIKMILLSKAIK